MNLPYDAELILVFTVLRYSHSAPLTHSRCQVLWGGGGGGGGGDGEREGQKRKEQTGAALRMTGLLIKFVTTSLFVCVCSSSFLSAFSVLRQLKSRSCGVF